MEHAVFHPSPCTYRSQAAAAERGEQGALGSDGLIRCLVVEWGENLPRGSVVGAGFDSKCSLADGRQHHGERNDAGNPEDSFSFRLGE